MGLKLELTIYELHQRYYQNNQRNALQFNFYYIFVLIFYQIDLHLHYLYISEINIKILLKYLLKKSISENLLSLIFEMQCSVFYRKVQSIKKQFERKYSTLYAISTLLFSQKLEVSFRDANQQFCARDSHAPREFS